MNQDTRNASNDVIKKIFTIILFLLTSPFVFYFHLFFILVSITKNVCSFLLEIFQEAQRKIYTWISKFRKTARAVQKKKAMPSILSAKKGAQKILQKARVELAFFFLSLQTKIRALSARFFIIVKKSQQLPKSKTLYKAPKKTKPTIRFASTSGKARFHNALGISTRFFLSVLWFFLGVVVTIVFVFLPYELYKTVQALPNPKVLATRNLSITTKIYDRNGILLYEIYADEDRTPLSLTEIPEHVKQATIAIEDREFYTHKGFSVRGILRAAREIAVNDRIQGGSTITQQLIKSALLTSEQTIQRKIKELFLALWAERIYTKNQILEMYLNQVPYGGTAWGIESAAQTYFGKSIKDVNLAEATLLAGLPAAPSDFSPFGENKEKSKERQASVLRRMVEDKYITQQQADEAVAQELHFATQEVPIRAPHFVLYVKDYLIKRYGVRAVERGGLRVKTTLDAKLQDIVQNIVRNKIEALKDLRVGNGAALVTDPRTGEILAMVGSKNYFDIEHDGNVNVTTRLRQPGSSGKPILYTAALEKGMTAASILDDNPVSYNIPGQPPYVPVNYDGRFHGRVPLRIALGNSFNIPAVKTINTLGIQTMLDKAKLMGIDTWNEPHRYGLSLALGGAEVTMMDMSEAYGALAHEGIRVDLTPIIEVQDYLGNTLEKGNLSAPVAATSKEVAWIMSNILSDNSARIQEFGPNSNLVIPGKTVSAKTGTTNEKRDNWTIGYTPSYVTTVWVGNNDNTPMHPQLASGITGAAPIWQEIMKHLLDGKQDEVLPMPEGVVALPCYYGKVEYFMKGTEPPGGRCMPLPTATPSLPPLPI